MNFEVNGSAFHCANGVFAVKPRFGLHSVLARADATSLTSPQTPLGRAVVPAVDALGRFLVEDKGVYCVTTFQAQEDYKPLLARKVKRELLARRTQDTKGKLPGGSRLSQPRRGSTAYTQFVGEFLRTFKNTSFTDASAAWRSLDSTARKKFSTKELIAKLVRKGRYELATSKRS